MKLRSLSTPRCQKRKIYACTHNFTSNSKVPQKVMSFECVWPYYCCYFWFFLYILDWNLIASSSFSVSFLFHYYCLYYVFIIHTSTTDQSKALHVSQSTNKRQIIHAGSSSKRVRISAYFHRRSTHCYTNTHVFSHNKNSLIQLIINHSSREGNCQKPRYCDFF